MGKHSEAALEGRWILIVEDDCVTAMDLAETLTAAGAQILGPATTLATAFELLHRRPQVDIALLDVEMEGEFVFGIADELVKREVPIVFTTGYERSEIPARFKAARHCEKPVGIAAIARVLSDELSRRAPVVDGPRG
ncbi:MAG TPA: response regulator [Steroidobacteraceae bacterium]|nr:response regulator [Steroidobacteraceae bacterium]